MESMELNTSTIKTFASRLKGKKRIDSFAVSIHNQLAIGFENGDIVLFTIDVVNSKFD
jgi:hypothetical protein